MVTPPPAPRLGTNVVFSDPAAGLERCIREAKAAVKGIKLHIALTHLGQCNKCNALPWGCYGTKGGNLQPQVTKPGPLCDYTGSPLALYSNDGGAHRQTDAFPLLRALPLNDCLSPTSK